MFQAFGSASLILGLEDPTEGTLQSVTLHVSRDSSPSPGPAGPCADSPGSPWPAAAETSPPERGRGDLLAWNFCEPCATSHRPCPSLRFLAHFMDGSRRVGAVAFRFCASDGGSRLARNKGFGPSWTRLLAGGTS